MDILCTPLSWLMKLAYSITGNYGTAIILFTLMTKIVLLPVSLWVHRNGIKMVKLEPAVNRLKVKYFGDPDTIAEEQAKLYKQAHYSPFATVIPVAIQVVLLIGLVQIIYHPEKWLGIADLNTRFLGFDLGATPLDAGGIHLLLPLLAGGAALVLSLCQNRMNPLQASQGRIGQLSGMAVSVGISLVLGFTVPAGVGFYWIWSNLMTIGQQALLNRIRRPGGTGGQPEGTGGLCGDREGNRAQPGGAKAGEGRLQKVLLRGEQAPGFLLRGQRVLQIL